MGTIERRSAVRPSPRALGRCDTSAFYKVASGLTGPVLHSTLNDNDDMSAMTDLAKAPRERARFRTPPSQRPSPWRSLTPPGSHRQISLTGECVKATLARTVSLLACT